MKEVCKNCEKKFIYQLSANHHKRKFCNTKCATTYFNKLNTHGFGDFPYFIHDCGAKIKLDFYAKQNKLGWNKFLKKSCPQCHTSFDKH